MTLESTVVKKQYDGDDSTVSFPTTFIFWDNTDIEVILLDALGVETTWVEGTQYTLSGGDGLVGTVAVETTPADYTPATGETLTIRSNRDDKQSSALPLGGSLPSPTIEQALDQSVRLIQQRSEEIERAVVLPKTTELGQLELPPPVAGRAIVWDSAGTGLENSDGDPDEAQTDSAASAAASAASADAAAASAATIPNTKIIEIGDWDMDATSQVLITHGLDLTKIRAVSVSIRPDDASALYIAPYITNTPTKDFWMETVNTTQVVITRRTGGIFDDVAYDSTGFNRGWVTIWYES